MIHENDEIDCEWMWGERIEGSSQAHENGLKTWFYKNIKQNHQKKWLILCGAGVEQNIFVKNFSKIFRPVWTLENKI